MRFAPLVLRVVVAAGMAFAAGGAAEAEGLKLSGKKNRAASMKSQMALLDGRLAVVYNGSDRLKPNYSKDDTKATDGPVRRFAGKYKGEYLEVARAAARKHGVPEDVFLRLVQQESGWNSGAVSVKGATGLAQLMPGTADRLGVDINDPGENLEGGARYLRMMYDRFGTWKLALAMPDLWRWKSMAGCRLMMRRRITFWRFWGKRLGRVHAWTGFRITQYQGVKPAPFILS